MRFLARLLSGVIPLTLLIAGVADPREWKAIQESGTIKAATEGAFQPFKYYEGSKLTGFEVELAEAIAKKLGYENAHSLSGGMGAWRAASLPVEKA